MSYSCSLTRKTAPIIFQTRKNSCSINNKPRTKNLFYVESVLRNTCSTYPNKNTTAHLELVDVVECVETAAKRVRVDPHVGVDQQVVAGRMVSGVRRSGGDERGPTAHARNTLELLNTLCTLQRYTIYMGGGCIKH